MSICAKVLAHKNVAQRDTKTPKVICTLKVQAHAVRVYVSELQKRVTQSVTNCWRSTRCTKNDTKIFGKGPQCWGSCSFWRTRWSACIRKRTNDGIHSNRINAGRISSPPRLNQSNSGNTANQQVLDHTEVVTASMRGIIPKLGNYSPQFRSLGHTPKLFFTPYKCMVFCLQFSKVFC